MEPAQYLEALRRDSAGLLLAARGADPSTTIAACPEWKPVDLVWHVGEVHWFWGTVVLDRLADLSGYVEPARPAAADDVFAFAQGSARRLTDALASTDPATEVWTWSNQRNAGFVIRRVAQETAMHRVDAERAAGRDHRIEPELAADGVDEFLVHFAGGDAIPAGESVHLHCTDTDGEWTVTASPGGGYAVAREHAKGDAAMRGGAHDLLMVLWRRAPLDTVRVFGDVELVDQFVTRTKLD